MYRYVFPALALCAFTSSAFAGEAFDARVEANVRAGSDRSIYMTEFWVPFAQQDDAVFYGDLRMMGDNQDNREGNLGVGYREITTLPILGKGVAGVNSWFDRRITERGSKFNQITLGGEWFGEHFDARLNGYIPLSDGREVTVANQNPGGAALAGTGILIDTDGRVLEEPQHGFDFELGLELGQYFDAVKNNTDSFRLYGGGYYFDGPNTENTAGWRTRFTADLSQNFQIGARFQRDDERGSQGFLEATIRFPFDKKTSYRREGLRARLDEIPERDIDIVTGAVVTDTGGQVAVINKATGSAQEVLHVDNLAAGGGDGSAEAPFDTLADAQAAASAHTIIYVARGNGGSMNQDQGITLNQTGQQLIGSGTDFVYDNGKFTTANGASPSSILIAAATSAPTIGNINPNQDGITISADNVKVAGIIVDNGNTGRDGIVVTADGAAASAQNVTIENVTARNSRMGVYVHGTNSGAASVKVQNTTTTANSQHGIAVYDDTDDTFDVDLGGGSMGSGGNNVLTGNTLEDLAVDYDGRELAAKNNWWGQASGADEDAPDAGIAPQIYYGAPINDGLVGHWTFDNEWTTTNTAYDRSGNNNNGTLNGGLSLADQVTGQNRQALELDGVSDFIEITDSASLSMNDEVSVLMWVKETGAQPNVYSRPFSKDNNGGGSQGYEIQVNVAGPNFYRRIDTSVTNNQTGSIGVFLDGNWNLATFTLDTGDVETYKNAASTASGVYNHGTGFNNNAPVYLGASGQEGSRYFKGVIDNVQIYNRALTPAEISELYRMNTSSSVNTGSFLTAAP